MARSPFLTTSLIALVAGLLGGAPAQADPLVSGYGGPGSGDQTVLGSKLLPGGGGGGGGGGARAGSGSERTSIQAASAAPVVPALTPVPRAAQAGTKPAQRRSSAAAPSGARGSAPATSSGGGGSPASAAATNAGANTSAGPLPVAGSDLLIVLAVLAGLGLAGLASARLAHSQRTPT